MKLRILLVLAVFAVGAVVWQHRRIVALGDEVAAGQERIRSMEATMEDWREREKRTDTEMARALTTLEGRLGPQPDRPPLAGPFEESFEKRMETIEAAITFDKLLSTRQTLDHVQFKLREAQAQK